MRIWILQVLRNKFIFLGGLGYDIIRVYCLNLIFYNLLVKKKIQVQIYPQFFKHQSENLYKQCTLRAKKSNPTHLISCKTTC